MHYYITGDCHGQFKRIEQFCSIKNTNKEDVMIILGDAGINYHLDERDSNLKSALTELPITLFCIHGNHEARPWECGEYEERNWQGGCVYVEQQYPNLLFAKDGEIYDIAGKKAIVIGGAYSIDKHYRLRNGQKWFKSEQPDDQIKKYVNRQLGKYDWQVNYVLSHTVPIEMEPTWAFIPGFDQSNVDKSTEIWLQDIYDSLTFDKWYAGHYHVRTEYKKVKIMYEDYEELI